MSRNAPLFYHVVRMINDDRQKSRLLSRHARTRVAREQEVGTQDWSWCIDFAYDLELREKTSQQDLGGFI